MQFYDSLNTIQSWPHISVDRDKQVTTVWIIKCAPD